MKISLWFLISVAASTSGIASAGVQVTNGIVTYQEVSVRPAPPISPPGEGVASPPDDTASPLEKGTLQITGAVADALYARMTHPLKSRPEASDLNEKIKAADDTLAPVSFYDFGAKTGKSFECVKKVSQQKNGKVLRDAKGELAYATTCFIQVEDVTTGAISSR